MATLSERIFDIEAGVLALMDDVDSGPPLTHREIHRVYIVYEKLDELLTVYGKYEGKSNAR